MMNKLIYNVYLHTVLANTRRVVVIPARSTKLEKANCFSDGRVVRASASEAVDSSSIPSPVKSTISKFVFIASSGVARNFKKGGP